ncbi:hypothetical protein P8625_14960 [Tenacibaculum tangerinum]|uniref:DUF4468 domain-containing protein n=1 Tax=Tenacibaculum tangerinum TaxID=3038772 RepID=A0ABY8L1N0_9FLAO|nr:hypothetical protein [Tenacibaculum tangerinum]WGH75352.1 hypothetical protein P8625_14960 [Tenacibaculum tangerinum]
MGGRVLISVLFFLCFNTVCGQTKTTMVSFSGYVNGNYVNVTAEMNYRFVFRAGEPEVQASWKWFKVNYVNYKGVRYSYLNNRKFIKFPYSLTSNFITQVELTAVPPTYSGFENVVKNMHGTTTQNFFFSLNQRVWNAYSITERKKAKLSWLETPFINRATILSLSGNAINSIFNDIEKTLQEEKEEKEEKKEKQKKTNKKGKNAKKDKDDFWSGKSTKKNKTTKDDFWSGKNTKKEKIKDDFWKGKGSQKEEAIFESQTKPPERNQFIGDIESYDTKRLTVKCLDHGKVDGDRVSVSLNGKVIRTITLKGYYTTFTINLKSGQNRIDFKALNEGSVGANTAKFYIVDDKGKTISNKEWNIKKGYLATLLIVTY